MGRVLPGRRVLPLWWVLPLLRRILPLLRRILPLYGVLSLLRRVLSLLRRILPLCGVLTLRGILPLLRRILPLPVLRVRWSLGERRHRKQGRGEDY